MNKEFAKKLLENVPQGDSHTYLRGIIGLYLDELFSSEQLTQDTAYKRFVHDNKKLISDLLFAEQANKKKVEEINNVHFNHHTTETFRQLGEKAAESGKTEYCKIKLAHASGMTEFPQTISRNEITKLVEELLGTQNNLAAREKFLDLVRNCLLEEDLLDRTCLEENVYRVGISLSSKKEICISIEHDSKKTESGFNGYLFSLSSDRKVIIDILERFGYDANENIEGMFGPIIIIKKGDIGDDDFDCV